MTSTNDLSIDVRFVTLIEVDAARGHAAHPKPHPPQAGLDHAGPGPGSIGVAERHNSTVFAGGAEHLVAVLEYFHTRSTARGTVTTEVATGPSVEAAVENLGWVPSEVVIVGSSRLARASTIFLGITANRMLHALPVPLIVVPNRRAPSDTPTRVPPTPAPPARTH